MRGGFRKTATADCPQDSCERRDVMKSREKLSRREFIEKTAVCGLAINAIPAHVLGGAGRVSPADRLNVALVGCGSMGLNLLEGWLKRPELQFVAACDPNTESWDYPWWGRPRGEERGRHGGREVGRRRINEYYAQHRGKENYKGCSAYADFRELLEVEKDLDAIFIMTPDHLHATIAVAAMDRDVMVATHKPIGNYMYETRVACETARKSGVPTHCLFFNDPPKTYTMMQLVKRGVIGKVTELHRWTNRPVWPQGSPHLPAGEPVPSGFDWQLWLGPSPSRPYSHKYTHTRFRGWYEFGGGCLADMGYYGLWRDWRVLNLGMPVSAKADTSFNCEIRDFRSTPIENEVSYPRASTIHFEVPVRGRREDMDVFWYDGGVKPKTPKALIEKGEELDIEGVMFVGEKGAIYTAYNGYDRMQILGVENAEDVVSSITVPEEYRERSRNEMIDAFRGVRPSRGNFQNAQTIAEAICLGNLAVRLNSPFSPGKRSRWDRESLKVTNAPEANRYVKRECRRGWELTMP